MRENIFVLDKVITLSDTPETGFSESTIYIKHGSRVHLKEAFYLLYNSHSIKQLFIFHPNFELLKKDFTGLFDIIEGAGGLVKNNKDEVLMIFRNGKWDIPKGKIEKGEKKDVAALREVEEECGINQLNIIKELPQTLHCYKLKNKFILKKTYWYLMQSDFAGKLVPQAEEGITKVKWIERKEIGKVLKNSYDSIKEMLLSY
jgi:ADP-ribose pyrophosphatase YjhB (NUDIX family)